MFHFKIFKIIKMNKEILENLHDILSLHSYYFETLSYKWRFYLKIKSIPPLSSLQIHAYTVFGTREIEVRVM